MPNWVYNTLTVEGNPDSVNRLKEQVNQPFTVIHDSWNPELQAMEQKPVTYNNPIFAFWNIIKPTDLEAYEKQPDYSLPWNELSQGNDWYNWNIRNWGVKWDVAAPDTNEPYSETNLFGQTQNGDNLVIVYRFDTPWGVATEALEKLSAQYPDLLLTLEFEEETGWGGEMEFLRGTMTEVSEYGWKCPECDHEEDDTPYCETCEYDMCPSCGFGEPMDGDREKCPEHKEKVDA